MLVVHPHGFAAARSDVTLNNSMATGDTVLIVDVVQTGDAERVQDVLTAVAWMKSNGARSLNVSGI